MIENNQLKEGNWVRLIAKTDSGCVDAPARVSEILDNGVKTTISGVGQINPFENLYGIPLTPEVIHKIGFVRDSDKNDDLVWEDVRLEEFFDTAHEQFNYSIWVKYKDGAKKLYFLEYVHELQNFFPSVLEKEIAVEL